MGAESDALHLACSHFIEFFIFKEFSEEFFEALIIKKRDHSATLAFCLQKVSCEIRKQDVVLSDRYSEGMHEIILDGPHHNMGRDCEPILRSLPAWFGIEEALLEYVRDMDRMPTFVALDGDLIVGFIALHRHFEYSAEMHVLGIRPEYHRKGIGRRLVTACEA